jgi:hypothetical protein
MLVTVDRKSFFLFPALDGANTPLQESCDLFPGIEAIILRRFAGGWRSLLIVVGRRSGLEFLVTGSARLPAILTAPATSFKSRHQNGQHAWVDTHFNRRATYVFAIRVHVQRFFSFYPQALHLKIPNFGDTQVAAEVHGGK